MATASQVYLILLLALAAIALVPLIFGFHGSVVQSGSMEPHISAGDVVLSTDFSNEDPVPVGGVVEFSSPAAANPSGDERTIMHRIVAVNDDGTFVTAGDANADVDSTPITRQQITGQARILVPFIGRPSLWLAAWDLGPLALWAILTLLALVVTMSTVPQLRKQQPPAGDDPEDHMRTRRQAKATAATSGTMALALIVVGTFSVSFPHTDAAFTARTFNAGSTWQTGSFSTFAYKNYRATIAADSPWAHYPLDEAPSVYTAQDATANNRDATYSYYGVTNSVPGALINQTNKAITLNGTSAATFATPEPAITNPKTFTVEMWFKTGSGQGGELISFGTNRVGTSGQYDRKVYMGTDGKLNFGTYTGTTHVITSPNSYNDSAWHHMAATLSSSGMVLYVDGQTAATNSNTGAENYTGYWRIGGDNTARWPNRPTNTYFSGSIDEISIYNTTALSATRVRSHYQAALASTVGNNPVEVSADIPSYYYHLEEGTSGVMTDSSGQGRHTAYPSTGVTYNVTGVLPKRNNRAAAFDGSDASLVGKNSHNNPQVFSTETWFKTTTRRGGQLIGFGSSTGLSSQRHDRHLYMLNDGRLAFGVYTGQTIAIGTPGSYNDGVWHHAVATLSSAGMKLYVDGELAASYSQARNAESYNGYWHIGAGQLSGWPSQPTSNYFNGILDEVAIYTTALSPEQVRKHYNAR